MPAVLRVGSPVTMKHSFQLCKLFIVTMSKRAAGALNMRLNMSQDNATSSVELTNRESEVVRLVAFGLSAKKVAMELDIAPCTVERHIENVRLKTRTRNRAHMIAYVIRAGMLPEQYN